MTEEGNNEYSNNLYKRVTGRQDLDSKIFNEIVKLERKPILLIGKDKELIQNTTREICSTRLKVYCSISFNNPFENSNDPITSIGSFEESGIESGIILREYSCIGKTETEIEHDLFLPKNLIRYYEKGDMFLVRGLNSKRILERLADSVTKYCCGLLFIMVIELTQQTRTHGN